MTLSLKESKAIGEVALTLQDFLPGSGHQSWKGHVNFGTVAATVGVGTFWQGGSKAQAVAALLSRTLEQRRVSFQPLVVEIVRAGIVYRAKQNRPITTREIDKLNGHILNLGFKFPELWDEDFRTSLQPYEGTASGDLSSSDQSQVQQQLKSQQRSKELAQLKEWFFQLAMSNDRREAGLTLEKLLNRLFGIFELQPREPFRVVGEQIDGSFELDNQIYLLESKWEKSALPEADLLVFRGKIEGKSTFTRGVFNWLGSGMVRRVRPARHAECVA